LKRIEQPWQGRDLRLPSPFRGGVGGGVSYLTPRPPSLRGQGERLETPLSVPGRGWGRGD